LASASGGWQKPNAYFLSRARPESWISRLLVQVYETLLTNWRGTVSIAAPPPLPWHPQISFAVWSHFIPKGGKKNPIKPSVPADRLLK
jgi:hypothetical protein